MKKILIALAVVIILLLAGLYLFIPSEVNITRYARFKSTAGGTERFLQKEKWNAWWPNKQSASDTSFVYEGYTFKPVMVMPGSLAIDVYDKSNNYSSLVTVLPLSRDSVGLTWECKVMTSSNPFQRLTKYNASQRLDKAMSGLIDTLATFLGKNENVYSMNISQVMVTDTLLLTMASVSKEYPTLASIYSMIAQLQKAIEKEGAKAVNPPMLYIEQFEIGLLRTQVAIPVNKPIEGSPEMLFKRMVPGKILMAEVKGGLHTVRNAFQQMEHYAEDYKKVSPAIPFEMLVTDRMQEKDTSKWVTRIYYPVL